VRLAAGKRGDMRLHVRVRAHWASDAVRNRSVRFSRTPYWGTLIPLRVHCVEIALSEDGDMRFHIHVRATGRAGAVQNRSVRFWRTACWPT
jgi:hypothetical protein